VLLDHRTRYLQIAFNYDLRLVLRILPTLPRDPRILIEAGTPFIKREGLKAVAAMRRYWSGHIVADLKVSDGAAQEVAMAQAAGATAATVMGSSPRETLNAFVDACRELKVISMVDLLGVHDPLDTMRRMRQKPDVMILHRGRDEETTRGKVLEYRHVKRIHSKFDVSIAAAGGVDLKEARSAIFNGANIVVVNLVRPGDPWQGISTEENVAAIAAEFLATIE
jgi:bifunctional enzyme Fae/Hps